MAKHGSPTPLESVFEGSANLWGVDSPAEKRLSERRPRVGTFSQPVFTGLENSGTAGPSVPGRPVARSPGRLNGDGWAASGRLQRLTTGRRTNQRPRLQSQVLEDVAARLLQRLAVIGRSVRLHAG